MTKPTIPFRIRDAATLPVSVINTNLAQQEHDINDGLQQRYTYSNLTINFGRIDHLNFGNDLKQFQFQAPYYFEILGVTLVAVTEGNQTLTLTATGLSGWENISVATVTAQQRYVTSKNFTASGAAASTPLFELTFSNNDSDIVSCQAIFNIRTDRGNTGSSHAGYDALRLAAGDTVSGTALGTEFTSIASAVARDTANNIQPSMQMFVWRAATVPITFSLPSVGRRFIQIDCGLQAANVSNNSSTWTLKDENGTTVSTASTGNTTTYFLKTSLGHTTGLPDTQPSSGTAYTLTLTPTVVGAGHLYDYCVLHTS